MSDEGLDKIFKEGLADRSVDFNMAAWRNMEQMLPPEPKAAFFTLNRVAAIVGLLLLVGASSFYFWNINETTENEFSVSGNTETYSTQGNSNDLELAVSDNSSSISAKAEEELDGKQVSSVPGAMVASNQGDRNENNSPRISAGGGNGSNLNTSFVNGTKGGNLNGQMRKNSLKRNVSDVAAEVIQPGGLTANSNVSSNLERNQRGTGNTSVKGSLEQQLLLSSNAFTQIDGLNELASMTFETEEEDETIIINVTNGNLPKVAKNVVGIIGGMNINPSLVEGGSNKESISEFAGISYQRYMNRGFSLKANLLYSARNGVNTSKLYEDKHYDFGGWTESMEIETKRLVYLELPVMLNYGVKNHNFMAGASFSYLINSLSSVKTASTHPVESSEDQNDVWGYNKGFSNIDMSIVAGYEYSVTPKLNLGGRVNYGLIDVTDNSYFNSNSFDNNIQFRVYVTYSPFQF